MPVDPLEASQCTVDHHSPVVKPSWVKPEEIQHWRDGIHGCLPAYSNRVATIKFTRPLVVHWGWTSWKITDFDGALGHWAQNAVGITTKNAKVCWQLPKSIENFVQRNQYNGPQGFSLLFGTYIAFLDVSRLRYSSMSVNSVTLNLYSSIICSIIRSIYFQESKSCPGHVQTEAYIFTVELFGHDPSRNSSRSHIWNARDAQAFRSWDFPQGWWNFRWKVWWKLQGTAACSKWISCWSEALAICWFQSIVDTLTRRFFKVGGAKNWGHATSLNCDPQLEWCWSFLTCFIFKRLNPLLHSTTSLQPWKSINSGWESVSWAENCRNSTLW